MGDVVIRVENLGKLYRIGRRISIPIAHRLTPLKLTHCRRRRNGGNRSGLALPNQASDPEKGAASSASTIEKGAASSTPTI